MVVEQLDEDVGEDYPLQCHFVSHEEGVPWRSHEGPADSEGVFFFVGRDLLDFRILTSEAPGNCAGPGVIVSSRTAHRMYKTVKGNQPRKFGQILNRPTESTETYEFVNTNAYITAAAASKPRKRGLVKLALAMVHTNPALLPNRTGGEAESDVE